MTQFPKKDSSQPDPWIGLRRHTSARLALGRAGISVPSTSLLEFKLAHAHARDAVYAELNIEKLVAAFEKINQPVCYLESRATSKQEYLQRPDLGRQLSAHSRSQLNSNPIQTSTPVSISVADGLSALAVNDHVIPLMNRLVTMFRESKITLAPFAIVQHGRVAISDEIGHLMRSEVSIILIGERPGLSSPNSLGAYLTYGPKVGLTDESRNCISNIRPEGLSYTEPAHKIFYLAQE